MAAVDPSYLDDWLSRYAAESPGAVAAVCRGRALSYDRLQEEVDHYAAAMVTAGVGKGDRVAVLACPGLEFWCAALASLRIGAIWLGLNPRYRARELSYLLEDCRPSLVLTVNELEGRRYRSELGELLPRGARLAPLEEFPGPAGPIPEHVRQEVRRMALARRPGDAAALVYTSGSTGRPKGALLSHCGLVRGASMQVSRLGVGRQSLVVSFPINHVACLADTCATTLISGGKIVFQERFDPAEVLRLTAEEQCNMLGGVPTMLQMILDEPGLSSHDLSSLELIAWGGAAMPPDYLPRLAALAPRLMTLYGLTETSANIVFGESRNPGAELTEAVGRPDPLVASRTVDEKGCVITDEQPGELQFRADFFFIGYWGRSEETSDAWTEDGWFRTGDVGAIDGSGLIRLRGRRSDMYKSGGYNVYPRELESVIERLPGVAAVVVVGVPDPLFQEVGFAWLVESAAGAAPAPDVERHCRTQLANYKVPRYIRYLRELPLLPVGKVDRASLKTLAAAELEREAAQKGTRH